MKYVFAAERKLIFIISAGGINRLVEFSDRNRDGGSSFQTDDAKVAKAIRKGSLYKRGVIQQVSGPTEEDEAQIEAMQNFLKRPSKADAWKDKTPVSDKIVKHVEEPQQPGQRVMEFNNITFAREAISRELGIPKAQLRSQAALDKAAKDAGIVIKYVAA